MKEIELKLELAPAHAERLRCAIDANFGAGETSELVSVYFDTPARTLRSAGYSLRIRHDGDLRIQTIKGGQDGVAIGLFDRMEWERPISSEAPDATTLADTPIAALDAGPDPLMPLFRSAVGRTVWRIQDGDTEFEIALDQGLVEAVGVIEPLCELELELKHGDPAALFEHARRFDQVAPIRLGVRSKADRGYRLLDKGRAIIAKAEPVRLSPDLSTAQAFAAIARSCLQHFRLNEPLVFELRDAEALHQARVATRRLRSALSLFKALFEDAESQAIKAELRWLAAMLGEARDLDVLLGRVTDPALCQRFEAARADAYHAVVATLDSARYRRLMLDFARWLEIGAWRSPEDRTLVDQPVDRFARQWLDKHHRRLARRGTHLAKLAPGERHQVRIAAKKLRYAGEFFATLFNRGKAAKRRRRFLKSLEVIQTHLGNLNDVETGRDLIRKLMRDAPDRALEKRAAREICADEKAEITAAQQDHDDFTAVKRFWR